MHNRHAWVGRTDDGLKREVRAIKTGGTWRFQAKRAGEQLWTYYDEPIVSDLEQFREIIYRKYQRRRAAYEDLIWADRELVRRRCQQEEKNAFEQ